MKKKTWILIGAIVVVVALLATVIGLNLWYQSGNVRVLGGKLRVNLTGSAYVIDHETGEVIGQTLVAAMGETPAGDKDGFEGTLDVMDYYNEADGTVTTTQGVLQGEDGYWEIHMMESCRHLEENEDGTSQVVNHSGKYSYIYTVHPDKQDFLIVRVKDKYEVYPLYVVMADSEEEALQIYRDFLAE